MINKLYQQVTISDGGQIGRHALNRLALRAKNNSVNIPDSWPSMNIMSLLETADIFYEYANPFAIIL